MRRLEKQLGEVAVVPTGSQASVLATELGVSLLFEPCERDVAQHRQVLGFSQWAGSRTRESSSRKATSRLQCSASSMPQ
jgi:hypothetical protein